MNPFLLFVLGIFSPLLLAMTLLVPPYVGVAAASYIIYEKPDATNPLDGDLDRVLYILDVYGKLFSYWWKNMGETSILQYGLPLIALPLIGGILGIWLTAKLSRKLHNTFAANH
jgi:hypothetical protein